MNIPWLTRGFDWLQQHLPFGINTWPSWSNELLGGILLPIVTMPLAALLVWPAHWLIHVPWVWLIPVTLLLAGAANEVYEHTADSHGYNPQDVLERGRGLQLWALGVIIGLLLR